MVFSSPALKLNKFVHVLRRNGFSVGPGEFAATLELVRSCDVTSHQQIMTGLRTLLCNSYKEWILFDRLFTQFWYPSKQSTELEVSAAALVDPRLRQRRAAASTGLAHAEASEAGWDEETGAGAGRQRALTRTDFRFLTDGTGRRDIETLAERLAYSLRKRFVRRHRIAKRGRRIHLRRTLRSSLAVGGLPVNRRYVVRRHVPPRLVLIQDISHSMAPYNPLFTRFIRGLLRVFRDAEAFAFHIELYRTTPWYHEKSDEALRKRLEGLSFLWMGGTRIAHSLGEFRHGFAQRGVNAKTIVILLSDGYDTDEPDELREELRELKQRARQLIWLNPAMKDESDIDDDPGLFSLKDSVDHLLPARTLDALAHAVELIATRG